MIALRHPYTSPTTTLTLPNPKLGNEDARNNATNHRYDMSGSYHSHKHGYHYRILKLVIPIFDCTYDFANFRAFLELVADGSVFQYVVDYGGVAEATHQVKLIPSTISAIRQSRNGRTINLELEVIS